MTPQGQFERLKREFKTPGWKLQSIDSRSWRARASDGVTVITAELVEENRAGGKWNLYHDGFLYRTANRIANAVRLAHFAVHKHYKGREIAVDPRHPAPGGKA